MNLPETDFSVTKKYCPVIRRNVAIKVHHQQQNREECLDCGYCKQCKNEYLNKNSAAQSRQRCAVSMFYFLSVSLT